jgi:hypothetical protein
LASARLAAVVFSLAKAPAIFFVTGGAATPTVTSGCMRGRGGADMASSIEAQEEWSKFQSQQKKRRA